jgi:hypothetical protein
VKLSLNGRTHRLLARLRDGECGFRCLYEATHAGVWTETRRKKAHQLLNVLQAEAVVAKSDRTYFILPRGEEELARLDREAGRVASVRLFERAAA